jgi:hypothetical protein
MAHIHRDIKRLTYYVVSRIRHSLRALRLVFEQCLQPLQTLIPATSFPLFRESRAEEPFS